LYKEHDTSSSYNLNNTPTAKKIAFVVHSETWGGKGVFEFYRAMKKVGHDVKILAVPHFKGDSLFCPIDMNFTKKFAKQDVIYPCGMKPPYKQCQFHETSKFDYIFIQNPYLKEYIGSVLDPVFLLSNLRNIAKKVVLVPYYPHIFYQYRLTNPDLTKMVDKIFVDSKNTKNIYTKLYDFPSARVVVSGYQAYKNMRQAVARSSHKETILWLPRWQLSFKYRNSHEGGSTFLNYHYFFYNYALQNPDKHLIIRPHQLLYTSSVQEKYLSQKDLDEIFAKYKKLKNVTIAVHNLVPLTDNIVAADIIVGDGTSSLAEVVVADKPIIYLSNGWNTEFNSNDLASLLKKYVLLAYEPNDILNHLDTIRNNHYKPLWDEVERRKFRQLVDPVKDPDEFIANYLLYDSVE
jgi:hypothetical protein